MNALIMNAGYLLRSSYVHKKGSTFKIRVADVGRLSTNAMPSILLSDVYLLICDKKGCFCAYYQNSNKKRTFLCTCKYMGTS